MKEKARMTKKILFAVFISVLETAWCVSLRSNGSTKEKYTDLAQKYTNNNLAAPKVDMKSMNIDPISARLWDNFENDLIESSPSRYVGNPSIHNAAHYIEHQFRSFGLDVISDPFPTPVQNSPNKETRNIIGRLVGSGRESILVGAHYDSLPAQGKAPGADDNASGVATLLSVARTLSRTSIPLKRNIIFVAFSGEEQGLEGSTNFAHTLAPTMNIKGAIILDQDGNPGSDWGLIFESVGQEKDKLRIIDTLADSADKQIGYVATNYKGYGSDHVSLTEEANIPSVLVIERDNMEFAQQYGHTSADTVDYINPEYGSAIARTVAQATVRLANA